MILFKPLHAVLILDVISAQLQQLQAAESRAEALQADRQLIQVEQHCTQDASSNKSAPRVHFADGEGACDSPVLARQANESGGENASGVADVCVRFLFGECFHIRGFGRGEGRIS